MVATGDQKPVRFIVFAAVKPFDTNIAIIGNFVLIAKNSNGFLSAFHPTMNFITSCNPQNMF